MQGVSPTSPNEETIKQQADLVVNEALTKAHRFGVGELVAGGNRKRLVTIKEKRARKL